jgi:HSP20 family protein
MSGAQDLAVREKQELANKEEKTTPGRYFVPAADIFETGEALTVVLRNARSRKEECKHRAGE